MKHALVLALCLFLGACSWLEGIAPDVSIQTGAVMQEGYGGEGCGPGATPTPFSNGGWFPA